MILVGFRGLNGEGAGWCRARNDRQSRGSGACSASSRDQEKMLKWL